MKRKRWRMLLLAGSFILAGCQVEKTAETTAVQSAADIGYGESESLPESEMEGAEDSSIPAGDSAIPAGQKRIVTRNIQAETEHFDDFWEMARKKTEDLGGYLESSGISGQKEEKNRSADLTIRIPAEQLDELTEEIQAGASVTGIRENTEDVTLQYVDTESRLSALRTEQESLLRLMEQAEQLEDVIAVQGRLTEVNYEIESYESRLRAMENQVTYSTLYLQVQEVERESSSGTGGGFWTEVKDGLENSLYRFGGGLREFAVAALIALPYLAGIGGLAALAVLLVRKIRRKKKQGIRDRSGKGEEK